MIFSNVKETISIEDDRSYKLLKISSSGISSIREEKFGREIKSKKMYLAQTGDVVYTKQSILSGGVSIISEDCDNVAVTNDMPVIRSKYAYLVWFYLFSSGFKEEATNKAIGVQGRVHFEEVESFLATKEFNDELNKKAKLLWELHSKSNALKKIIKSDKGLIRSLLGFDEFRNKDKIKINTIDGFSVAVGQATTDKLVLKNEGDHIFVRVGNVTTGGEVETDIPGNKFISNAEFISVSDNRKTKYDGVLFAISGAVKKAGVVKFTEPKAFTNGLAQVTFNTENLLPEFLCILFNEGYFEEDIKLLLTGVIPYFGKPEIESLSIPNVSIDNQRIFVKKYEHIKKIDVKLEQVRNYIVNLTL